MLYLLLQVLIIARSLTQSTPSETILLKCIIFLFQTLNKCLNKTISGRACSHLAVPVTRDHKSNYSITFRSTLYVYTCVPENLFKTELRRNLTEILLHSFTLYEKFHLLYLKPELNMFWKPLTSPVHRLMLELNSNRILKASRISFHWINLA